MAKALINPNIVEQGLYQVAHVSENIFDVASPLFWIDCPDDALTYVDWYDPVAQTFNKLQSLVPSAEQNKQRAIKLLSLTDWVNQPDVTDVSIEPHLLNKDAFIEYRASLRRIATSPVAGDIEWPIKPDEQWSS